MDAPQKPDSGPAPSKLGRARQQGLSGLQASTMGLVLAGCITLGFLLGQWLDARLNTTYWMPVLVVLGVIAGFREMFRTVVSINRHSQSLREQSLRERAERSINSFSVAGQGVGAATEETITGTGLAQVQQAEPERTRPRVFKVPPPPQSSFARRAANDRRADGEMEENGAIDKIDKQGALAATGDAPVAAQGGNEMAGDEPLTDAAEFARLTQDVDMLKQLLDDDQSSHGDQSSREEK